MVAMAATQVSPKMILLVLTLLVLVTFSLAIVALFTKVSAKIFRYQETWTTFGPLLPIKLFKVHFDFCEVLVRSYRKYNTDGSCPNCGRGSNFYRIFGIEDLAFKHILDGIRPCCR